MGRGRGHAFKVLWNVVRGRRSADGPSVGEQLMALPRMAVATLTGRYTGLDRGRLLLMALAVAYVVSPVDLVPEAVLLLAGMADDAMVLAWLSGAVLAETEAFLAWEAAQTAPRPSPAGSDRVVPGQVV